mgnify:CR=1 FL=1
MRSGVERAARIGLTPFDLARPEAGLGHFPRFAGEAYVSSEPNCMRHRRA